MFMSHIRMGKRNVISVNSDCGMVVGARRAASPGIFKPTILKSLQRMVRGKNKHQSVSGSSSKGNVLLMREAKAEWQDWFEFTKRLWSLR